MPEASPRDPRITPIAGDLLIKGAIGVQVDFTDDEQVYCARGPVEAERVQLVRVTHDQWREQSADAQIYRRGDA